MQKARTIEDHRTRYPRRADSAQAGPHNDAEPSDVVNPPNPPNPSTPPTSSPGQQPMQDLFELRTPAFSGIEGGDDMDVDPPVPRSPLVPGDNLPPFLQDDLRRPDSPIAANIDPEILAVAEEMAREYRFDRLIDEGDHRRQYGQGDDAGSGDEELGFGHGNGFDDIDLGLPNDEHQGVDPAAAALPRFQLREDVELDDPEDQPDADGGDDDPDALCAAFREPDLIRNAYIDAFVQKTLYGATHRALKHQLKAARRTISAHPDIAIEHVTKMAQTIGTVERRLGVNTDDLIITFTLCPVCKRRYSPEYIRETDNEHCLNDGCPGILFTVRALASGGRRRVSNLTYPYASPIAWLRHMLIQPGMAELMQTWRTEDDHELAAPVSSQDWMRDLNHNQPLGDITDGWGWRSTAAALHRGRDPITRDIVDESEVHPPIRFVSLPFGISFSLNTDWWDVSPPFGNMH
ncbi:hypothetical protein FRC08_009397 [Ceratobasidium sp. 394]|nr:hypothetical protein FRC08_009397 [Ceratobasidium sp. 394]